MSRVYRSGEKVRALYKREWYHAEIIRLEPDGRYFVQRIKPKGGRVDYHSDSRPERWWVEEDDLRPMQAERGNFSGF